MGNYQRIDMNLIVVAKNMFLSWVFRKLHFQTIDRLIQKKRTKNKLVVDGREYTYLFHSYNNMGITERSVEIPIIFHYLNSRKFSKVLEIGNVTNYYEDYFAGVFPSKTVVDKIEVSYNVITSDIAKFKPDEKFDFIFSISTFEHMDSDLGRNPDYVKDKSKYITVAADNIVHCYENLLTEGGLMVITAPMGYTPEWDATFKSDFVEKYPFKSAKRKLFKRINEEEWIKVDKFSIDDGMKYDTPFPYANYVSIIEFEK